MNEKIEKALAKFQGLIDVYKHTKLYAEDAEALATIREALTDYEKSEAEIERLNGLKILILNELADMARRAEKAEANYSAMVKGHVALLEAEKHLRGKLTKAEAAHIKDLEHIKARDDSFGVLLGSNIRLEEELARWKPLIEAVEKGKAGMYWDSKTGGSKFMFYDDEPILRAALAYKEQHET